MDAILGCDIGRPSDWLIKRQYVHLTFSRNFSKQIVVPLESPALGRIGQIMSEPDNFHSCTLTILLRNKVSHLLLMRGLQKEVVGAPMPFHSPSKILSIKPVWSVSISFHDLGGSGMDL
jgi:hypothetical protein